MPNDSYAIIELKKENKENIPSFNIIKKKVYEQWMSEEIKYKTEFELKKLIKNKKVAFIPSQNIKRNQYNVIKDVKSNTISNEIFELKQNVLTFININEGAVAVKVVNKKIMPYKIDKENLNELNLSLSKSFFNDFSKYYIEILSAKHKLKRNYQELESYLGKIESN